MTKIKVKYVSKNKLYPATGFALYKTRTVYVSKSLPKSVQKFLIEHEKFHIRDYDRLKKKGKKDSLFWCELKAYVYAFLKQPLGGILGIIRNLYPPKFISFIRLYANDEENTNKIAKRLEKIK